MKRNVATTVSAALEGETMDNQERYDENLEQLKSMINAIGQISEILQIIYQKLVGSGFSNKEALYLVGQYMTSIFPNPNKQDPQK